MLTATKTNNYKGALQQPLQSGFSATSTAMKVISGIDLYGKTAIVTSGYAGIGLETVKALSKANVAIWVPARDTETATKSLAGIPRVQIKEMDLTDPASIERFASDFISSDTSCIC